MQFRPCIDLHEGRVKQIVGGSLSDADNSARVHFETSRAPDDFVRLYRQDGLRGGHVIRLGPGNDEAAKAALRAWPGALQMGGGVHGDNAGEFIALGASHVIVTSYVFSDGRVNFDHLDKLVERVGKERVVLDLSCKLVGNDYVIVTDRWQNMTSMTISQATFSLLEGYCDEFLIHAASVEGLMAGPDLDLVKRLADYATIPVTYAGGIASFEDIDAVKAAGHGRVDLTIGSALDIFGGHLSYKEVVERCRPQ